MFKLKIDCKDRSCLLKLLLAAEEATEILESDGRCGSARALKRALHDMRQRGLFAEIEGNDFRLIPGVYFVKSSSGGRPVHITEAGHRPQPGNHYLYLGNPG